VSLSFGFNSEMLVFCACGRADGSSGVNGVCRDQTEGEHVIWNIFKHRHKEKVSSTSNSS